MQDTSDKMSRNLKWTYMGHLAKIETWLFTDLQDLEHSSEMSKCADEIEEVCSDVNKNFDQALGSDMSLEKRITVVLSTTNILLRIYTINKSSMIKTGENLQSTISNFTNSLVDICQTILGDGENDTKDLSDSLSTKPADDIRHSKYAANIFDSLLTNFAQDALLKRCLDSLFSNEAPSQEGIDTLSHQYSETIHSADKENLINIIRCASWCAGKAIIPSVDDFNKKYQSLMNDLCIFADKCFDDTSNLFEDIYYINVVYCILSLVWNLSDKIPLVPLFVKAGYGKTTVKWVSILFREFEYSPEGLCNAVIAIIHNLSRHEMGLNDLRKNKAFETLIKYTESLQWKEKELLDDLSQTFAMSLIALAENDEEQTDNSELICKASDKLYYLCIQAAERNNLKYDGFHLSEVISSLERALSNMTIVRYILREQPEVEKEPIEFFAELSISFYGSLLHQESDDHQKLIVKSLLRILLYISSFPEYREKRLHIFNVPDDQEKLKEKKQKQKQFEVLIESLTKLQQQDYAKRIWSNLQLQNNPESRSSDIKSKKPPKVYISYNWANKKKCTEFFSKLSESTNIDIWVDYKNAGWYDDMWDHIAPAIQKATLVIVLLSNAYCDSKVNFQELSYAINWAKVQPGNEHASILFVETEDGIAKKREWIRELTKDKKIVSYGQNIDLVDEVLKHDLFKKQIGALNTYSLNNAPQSRVCTIM